MAEPSNDYMISLIRRLAQAFIITAMKSSASPIEIAQTIYDGFSRNDLGAVLALCAKDVVFIHDPVLPWGGTFHGSAGVTEFGRKLITAIDSSIEAEQLFQAGDRVVQYGRTTGSVRASGAAFDVSECHLWTIRDGFVQEAEFLIDTSAMLLALSAPPTTQTTNTVTAHLGGEPQERAMMTTSSRIPDRPRPFLRRRAFLSTLVIASIATSCGGSTKSSGATVPPRTPTTIDVARTDPAIADGSGTDASACQLLSDSDVTTAMQQPMKVVAGAGAAICTYAATADPSILLAVQTFATRADATLYESLEPSSTHIDGLADNAFWNSTLDMVFVRQGERSFTLTSPSLANLAGDPQASQAAMVALANIVLTKF
jgi:hypothetical protein